MAAAGSDDEDGDGEDSDGEDEEGRARKKPKVAPKPVPAKKERPPRPPPVPIPTIPGQVPEKRKRGRPRKNPLPIPPAPVVAHVAPAPAPHPRAPATATAAAMMGAVPPPIYSTVDHSLHTMPMQQDVTMHQHQVPVQQVVEQQQGNSQYLLAIFAFFSVLNSPLASSYSRPTAHPHPQHSHHGHVLSETPVGPYAVPIMPPSGPSSTHTILGYNTPDLIQAFHLFVSTMVLFYVVMPWLSDILKRRQSSSFISHITSFFTRPHAHIPSTPTPEPPNLQSSTKTIPGARQPAVNPLNTPECQNLVEALTPARRGAADEAVVLRRCLGVSTGVLGLMQGVIKAARHNQGIELDQLEQRAWVRLGELVAFDGKYSLKFY